jgi:hypothetical protein
MSDLTDEQKEILLLSEEELRRRIIEDMEGELPQ